jgi:hypothetical protein
VFQIPARTIRHNEGGYYVFPKPGFHLRSFDTHTTAGKSDAGYRHGGLSMAEVVVPIISLRHRSSPTAIFLSVDLRQAVQAGLPATIQASVSADGVVQSPIRFQADTNEVEPIIVSGATSTPTSYSLRFTAASPGRHRIRIDALLGEQVAASAFVDVDVATPAVPEDEAKKKLRKLWGDD